MFILTLKDKKQAEKIEEMRRSYYTYDAALFAALEVLSRIGVFPKIEEN